MGRLADYTPNRDRKAIGEGALPATTKKVIMGLRVRVEALAKG